jgi:hypothetical protein
MALAVSLPSLQAVAVAAKAAARETTFFARLFLGASLHARFLTGGEADAELVRAAVVNLRECRRDFPTFAPLPEFFSPRFIEFYSVYATPADVAEEPEEKKRKTRRS